VGIQAADVHKAPSEDAASRASLTKTALRTDPSADELPSHANPTILGPVQAQRKWVQRSPEKLHLHPALVRLDLGQAAQDTAQAVRSTTAALLQTIVITTDGTLIAGLSAWRKAVDSGLSVVDCIEYPLTSQEALEAILIHNQPRRTWNNFTRVRLALELETYF